MKKSLIILAIVCCAFAAFAGNDSSQQEVINKFSYFVGASTFANNADYYGLDVASFVQGALDIASGKYSLTEEEVNQIFQDFGVYFNERLKAINLAYAESFLEENKKTAGVVTTKSGLQYKITQKGSGKTATKNSTVSVKYTLTLPDGTIADQAIDTPASFKLTDVVAGFAEACMAAPVGSKLTAWIHPSLGYGENAVGNVIEPNSLLQFDIEIVSVN